MSGSRQLNPFISVKDSGKVSVKSEVITCINEHLCNVTKCNELSVAHIKLRRESKTRIKTKHTFYPEVFSVPKSCVQQWTKTLDLKSIPGLNSKSDLVKGKYEGGFKVWESTVDLIKFITEDESLMVDLLHRDDLKILEIGAGAALPSLALLGRLIEDPLAKTDYRLHVQDYNWEVLTTLTLLNFSVNLPTNYFQALIESRNLRFFYGDWKNFRTKSMQKYDLIMMSEVIYDSSNYEALHDLLDRNVKPGGIIVIATKDTYFGLSGGIYSWLDYLDDKSVFSPFKIIKVTVTNVPRSILILKRSAY